MLILQYIKISVKLVENNISICNDCMIGASGVVVKDILIPGTYIGVPATMEREKI